MELVVRLTATVTESTSDLSGGLVVGAVCSAALLVAGLAHYAGVGKGVARIPMITSTTTLALAWLGAGGLLTCLAALVLQDASPARSVLGLLLGALGLACWVVGLVGLFWLPQALRPRWLRESGANPPRADGSLDERKALP
jgi:hypothetical protein